MCLDPKLPPVACAPGNYSFDGATECLACASGRFNGAYNLSYACDPCEDGFECISFQRDRQQACKPGWYRHDPMTACELCPPGRYNTEDYGQSQCHECPAGFYCLGNHTPQMPCPFGFFAANVRASYCDECLPGQYAATEVAQLSCHECAPGHFCGGRRFLYRELPCPRGYSQGSSASSQCEKCVVGRFAPLLNVTECWACPDSTSSETEGDFKCSCEPDYFMFVDDDLFFRTGFQLDRYSINILNFSAALEAATPDETRIAAEFGGDLDAVEVYVDELLVPFQETLLAPALNVLDFDDDGRLAELHSIAFSLDRSHASCLPCPTETSICAGGTEFLDGRIFPQTAVKSAAFYWQDENLYFDSSGAGRVSALNYGGGADVSSSNGSSFPLFENCFTDVCAEGDWSGCTGNNSGILCNSCSDSTFCVDEKGDGELQDGFNCNSSFLFEIMVGEDVHFAKDGYDCQSCDQSATEYQENIQSAVAWAVGLVVVGVAIIVVAWKFKDKWWPKVRENLKTGRAGPRRRDPDGSIMSKALMLLNYMQIQAMFMRPETLQADFDKNYTDSMSWMEFANVDVMAVVGCSARLSYPVQFLVFALVPVVLAALFLLVHWLFSLCMGTQARWLYMSAYFVRVAILVAYVLYAQVSRTVIRIFDCHEFPAEGVARLKAANYALICWQGQRHAILVILAVLFTALYAAGFPIALFVILYRFRHELNDSCDENCGACNIELLDDPESKFVPIFYDKHMQHEEINNREYLRRGYHMPNVKFDSVFFLRFSQLVKGYKENHWHFEIFNMFHKLFLVVLVVFLDAGSATQLAVAMVEIVLFAGFIAISVPHVAVTESIMYTLIHLSLFLLLMTAMFKKARFDDAEAALSSAMTWVSSLPLILGGLMILYPLGEFVARKIKEKRVGEQRKAIMARRLAEFDLRMGKGGPGRTSGTHVPSDDRGIEGFDIFSFTQHEANKLVEESKHHAIEMQRTKPPPTEAKKAASKSQGSAVRSSDTEVQTTPLVALHDFRLKTLRDNKGMPLNVKLVRFRRGEPLVGLQKASDLWWVGYSVRNKLLVGLIPANHVEERSVDEPEFRTAATQKFGEDATSGRRLSLKTKRSPTHTKPRDTAAIGLPSGQPQSARGSSASTTTAILGSDNGDSSQPVIVPGQASLDDEDGDVPTAVTGEQTSSAASFTTGVKPVRRRAVAPVAGLKLRAPRKTPRAKVDAHATQNDGETHVLDEAAATEDKTKPRASRATRQRQKEQGLPLKLKGSQRLEALATEQSAPPSRDLHFHRVVDGSHNAPSKSSPPDAQSNLRQKPNHAIVHSAHAIDLELQPTSTSTANLGHGGADSDAAGVPKAMGRRSVRRAVPSYLAGLKLKRPPVTATTVEAEADAHGGNITVDATPFTHGQANPADLGRMANATHHKGGGSKTKASRFHSGLKQKPRKIVPKDTPVHRRARGYSLKTKDRTDKAPRSPVEHVEIVTTRFEPSAADSSKAQSQEAVQNRKTYLF